MFESAELGHTIDKERFIAEVPALREALLDAQYDLLESKKFPVIIIIAGVDGAGKGETVNVLNDWMDARHIQTHALAAPSADDTERPAFYRFWRHLPPRGKTGIFFTSW
jgi:polyphosphate kinase 2 (PPK2 family)